MKQTISVKELPAVPVIACRHTGPYQEIGEAFVRLDQWAKQNELFADEPKMFAIYHSDLSIVPADQLLSDACIEDKGRAEPGQGMQRITLSGGKYMVAYCEITMAEFGEAWCQAYAALDTHGYECDTRDQFEVYLNDPGMAPDALWQVEICIPIK